MHDSAAPRNLDSATPQPSAEAELRITIELRTEAAEIAATKPDLSEYGFEAVFQRCLKGK